MRRKVTIGVLLGLLSGVITGSVVVAWVFPRVDTSPIENATKTVLVTGAVEERPVRELFSISAQMTHPTVASVMPVSDDAIREVVSGMVHQIGDVIRYGDVVAEVSGRPVFAMPASLPLYRDLYRDATGSDVAGLQQVLADLGLYSGAVDGDFGRNSSHGIVPHV